MSETILEKTNKAVDRKTGLITSVYQVATEPDDPHLFFYNAVLSHAARYAPLPVEWRRIQGGGVDTTREGAVIAAVGECFERYCPMMYSKEDLQLSTFSHLQKEGLHAVSPEKFSLFSKEQYESPGFFFEPIDDESLLNWVWGYSFTDFEPVLVPAAFVFLPYVYPDRKKGEVVVTPSISTGLSCRDTVDSALLYGILEVIERDALTLTWLNQIPAPEIDIEEVEALKELFSRSFGHMGGEFHLFDITTDVKVPVVMGGGFFSQPGQPAAVMGASCRPSVESAALKALTEIGQEYPVAKWLMKTNQGYIYSPDYSDVIDFDNHVHFYTTKDSLSRFNFLFEDESQKVGKELSGSNSSILKEIIQLLKDKTMDVIAVDLTTSDVRELGFYTVRVIVPQLQPLNGDYRFRVLGGKRLHEYRNFKEFNPFPHPFP